VIHALILFLALPFSVRQFLQTATANSHTDERLTLILPSDAMLFTSVHRPSVKMTMDSL